MKKPILFQGEIITKKRKYIDEIFKNLFLHNHWANLNQTWHNASLDDVDLTLLKWRDPTFSKGENYQIAKYFDEI